MGRGSEGKEEGESGREIEGPQRGGRSRLGYLSRGRDFLVTPLAVGIGMQCIEAKRRRSPMTVV